MALGSVLQTALSGLSAAEAALQVLANNLANSQTAGFKASRPVFASQSVQTASLGAAPTDRSGGSNPVQVGRGTLMAGATELSNTDVGRDLVALFRMASMHRIGLTLFRTTEGLYEELAGLPRPK